MNKAQLGKLFFTVIGLVGLSLIIRNYGVDQIVKDINSIGFNIIWILLSFIPVVFCYGLSWQLVTNYQKFNHSFLYNSPLFTIYAIISIAWNNLTPFLKIGGEPVKYMLLKRHLSHTDALNSTINYNIIHIISTLLSLMIFSFLTPLLFQGKSSIFFISIGSSIALILSIIIYLAINLSKMKNSAPLFLRQQLSKRKIRIVLFVVKRSIRKLYFHYQHDPQKVILAIFFDTLARFIEGLTFYLAFHYINHHIPFIVAMMLDIGRTFIDTFFFFIPYQIGAREEGIRFFMENVFNISSIGFVTVVLLYRVVEIFWICCGYIMWLFIKPTTKRDVPTL